MFLRVCVCVCVCVCVGVGESAKEQLTWDGGYDLLQDNVRMYVCVCRCR